MHGTPTTECNTDTSTVCHCKIAFAQVDGTTGSINELSAEAEALLHIDDSGALLRARAALTPSELATVSVIQTIRVIYCTTHVCTQ
jgi:hypothetical protein